MLNFSALYLISLFAFLICTESSKSITPALVLSKFLQSYEEMAQEAEGDPWISVLAWVEHPVRAEWDIKSGVNFMQFVDCLGVSMILCVHPYFVFVYVIFFAATLYFFL